MKKSNAKNYLFIAVLLQITWGFTPTASTIVINEIPIELYIAIRWTISAIIFIIYLFIMKKWQKINFIELASISLLGCVGYGLASICTLYGLKIGGVINFALICAIGPIFTSLISIWILKEKPVKLFFLALPISILGVVLLSIGKYQISSDKIALFSVGLIIIACILEAFVFVFSKKFKTRVNTIQYLAITQIAAAVLMWILQGTIFHQVSMLSNLSYKGVLAALFVSIVACVLCYAILYWLLNFLEGHRLALFEGIHALSATLFGYFIFNEHVSKLMFLGGFLILLGPIIGNLPSYFNEHNTQ